MADEHNTEKGIVAKAPANVGAIKSEKDLKAFLAANYMAQIKNFFGEEKQALKFLSSVMADVQKNPKLLECNPMTLINSYMTMAQLSLMPSGVSGEAYVLPYNNKNGMVAQFQLGYQGLITLFYRAGGTSIRAEIVREHDVFEYENGVVRHKIDIFKSNAERGQAVGAYAIAVVNGHEIAKAMNAADILAMGKKFSKSYSSGFSPWNEEQDPELWMWKKTVLKQLGKMMPKNETIYKAIAEDNEDSIIADRQKMEGLASEAKLNMGNFAKPHEENKKDEQPAPAEGAEPVIERD